MPEQGRHYIKPSSVKEALKALREYDHSRIIAGGTDVMIRQRQRTDLSTVLIDITAINTLRGIRKGQDQLEIGASTTLASITENSLIDRHFPILAEAAQAVAAPVHRHTATIGGNILCDNRCFYYNQSDWWREAAGHCLKDGGDICIATGGPKACFAKHVSDTVPALISMEAQLKITNPKGQQTVPLISIYTGDGIRPFQLPPNALLTAIQLPLQKKFRGVFKKLRLRKSLEFTSLTTAVTVDKDDELRVAVGGVDPKPILAKEKWPLKKDTEAEWAKKILKQARSIDNEMFSRQYRRKMLKHYLHTSFQTLKTN